MSKPEKALLRAEFTYSTGLLLMSQSQQWFDWFPQWSEPDSMWSHAANRYMTHIASGSASFPPSVLHLLPCFLKGKSRQAFCLFLPCCETGPRCNPRSKYPTWLLRRFSQNKQDTPRCSWSLSLSYLGRKGGEGRKAMDHRLRIKGLVFCLSVTPWCWKLEELKL